MTHDEINVNLYYHILYCTYYTNAIIVLENYVYIIIYFSKRLKFKTER